MTMTTTSEGNREKERERDSSHLVLIFFEIPRRIDHRSILFCAALIFPVRDISPPRYFPQLVRSNEPTQFSPWGHARRSLSISRRPRSRRRRRRRQAGSSTIFCAIVSAIFASPFLSTASRCKRKRRCPRRRRIYRSRDTPLVRFAPFIGLYRRETASKRLLLLSPFRKRKRDLAGGSSGKRWIAYARRAALSSFF